MKIKTFILFSLILLSSQVLKSADTLKVSINKADSLFLIKNLSLLSAKYNISVAKALKIQAKVYPNPSIYFEHSLVNKYTRANYDIDPTRTGSTETLIQANQLILLAGKRNKQIKLADINIKLTENDFENLLRTLRYHLHTDLSQLYYNQQALRLLLEEHKSIDELSDNIDEQVTKGFISLSESIRIKSLLLEIDKEINEYSNTNYDLIAEINTLLFLPPNTYLFAETEPIYNISFMPFNSYLDSATVHNPDIKKSDYLTEAYKAQYSLNKAMAVPDANLQFVYDQSGSYIRNYYGLGVGVSLPAFNRNQGNIKASKIQLIQSENDLKLQQQSVSSLLFSNYQSSINNQRILKNYSLNYENQLLSMMDKVLENYQKRIITLVDFTNYYESYKQGYLSLLQIKATLNSNIEQINFLIGKPILK
jgi:cobalt-zinc-cadmium efflux system outer membrane protein